VEYVTVHSDLLRDLIRKIDDLQTNVNALHKRLGTSVLSRKQFAEELGKSPRTISRWIADGKVFPINSTGRPQFDIDELNRVKGKLKMEIDL